MASFREVGLEDEAEGNDPDLLRGTGDTTLGTNFNDFYYCQHPNCGRGGLKGYYYEIDGDGKEAETKSRLLGCACKTAWYCCKEHQKSDWKRHKMTCKIATKSDKPLASSKDHKDFEEHYTAWKARHQADMVIFSQSLLNESRVFGAFITITMKSLGGGAFAMDRHYPLLLNYKDIENPPADWPEGMQDAYGDAVQMQKQFRQLAPPQHRRDRVAHLVVDFHLDDADKTIPTYRKHWFLGSGLGERSPLPLPTSIDFLYNVINDMQRTEIALARINGCSPDISTLIDPRKMDESENAKKAPFKRNATWVAWCPDEDATKMMLLFRKSMR